KASGSTTTVPTRTHRSVIGLDTLNVAARAIAKTVPGSAHGSATSVSIAPRNRPAASRGRRRPMSAPAASARTRAANVLTVAIHSEFTRGRSEERRVGKGRQKQWDEAE